MRMERNVNIWMPNVPNTKRNLRLFTLKEPKELWKRTEHVV